MMDYLGIFKKLNEEGIRYFVVGGLAVNFYGIPRMTYDVDIVLDLQDDNVAKFLHLMKEWGFRPKAPVDIMDFAKPEQRQEWIQSKNMKAFNFVNPAWAIKEIDVIIDSPVDYEQGSKHMKMTVLREVSIPTVSLDDLIKMKEVTDRQQDEADIRHLKGLHDE